ncbi:glycosyltransferase family 4 protein [Oscillatoria sp. CS-180]|uniref:glycosyltransferase family 4 protein n=1 Tax=Oscillatoria sp. CS-180 TaxID=3021720 RepID=UPI00232CEA2C|nr:glycosyltransferase family 4 protein [Oscillatoria sp. CS-180]MDB9525800.1 glycosyltransferase family 4 protein [Oscillatoria sp. CS-180]
MKIAIVHEWLDTYAGSERVVEQLLNLYPTADLFSLVDFLAPDERSFIQNKSANTSFIQQLPLARKHFRKYLPLMPIAIEQFDLSQYDIIISSNHAMTKGVVTRADQLHISYMHTPIRYAWDLQWQYLEQAGLKRGIKGALTRIILHYLRLWDVSTANRVDYFVANSHFIARRIEKTYRRQAKVIYPPVAVHQFRADRPREDFYLTVSRFVPYKRVDLTIAAFNQLGLPLVVIGDGADRARLESIARSNIQFLGYQTDSAVIDYMERCKAFVFPAEEDFGITPVEAQAAGAPVIAYGRGGVTETVLDRKTGLLFTDQTVEAMVSAIKSFATSSLADACTIRHRAKSFSEAHFRQTFDCFLQDAWQQFQEAQRVEDVFLGG